MWGWHRQHRLIFPDVLGQQGSSDTKRRRTLPLRTCLWPTNPPIAREAGDPQCTRRGEPSSGWQHQQGGNLSCNCVPPPPTRFPRFPIVPNQLDEGKAVCRAEPPARGRTAPAPHACPEALRVRDDPQPGGGRGLPRGGAFAVAAVVLSAALGRPEVALSGNGTEKTCARYGWNLWKDLEANGQLEMHNLTAVTDLV